MAQNRLGGPGIQLPFPQALYPQSLSGAAITPATSVITLAPGQALPVPGGDWAIAVGRYTFLQAMDPVSDTWLPIGGSAGSGEVVFIHSDGQNIRIANLTGCPVGAVVTAAGGGYTAGSVTVTASAGGSVWSGIVGGALTEQQLSLQATTAASGTGLFATITFPAQTAAPPVGSLVTVAGVTPAGYNVTNAVVTASTTTTVTYANTQIGAQTVAGTVTTNVITNAGSGYTVPPIVFIPAPPAYGTLPGMQATAYASISSGTVSGITMTNQGAGYTTAPSIALLPSPYDPNVGAIVNATAVTGLTGAGQLTGVVCLNNGAPQTSAPALTVAGASSTTASVSPVMCWTTSSISVAAGGAGYTTSTEVTSLGGRNAAPNVWANPLFENQIINPRPLQASVALSSGTITSIGTIYDGGLFAVAPTPLVLTNVTATTAATVSIIVGSVPDTSFLQPL